MLRNQLVYIIGFMGSGKTTVGKKLSSALGWTFIDLDREIEERAGLTIPQIFSQYGEEHFRTIESQVLKESTELSDTVISTGGGAPCFNDNMDLMLSAGITVYLKLTPPQLKERLSGSSTERPLIKDLSGDDLLTFIKLKLSQREKHYMRAHIIFNGYKVDVNELLSRIMFLQSDN